MSGVVEHVGLRSTRLRKSDGTVAVVPNAQLSDGQVNNYGRPNVRAVTEVDLTVGVSHETTRESLDVFVGRLRDVFAAQPLAVPGAEVALARIGPSSIDIELKGQLATDDATAFAAARHELLADIVALAHEMDVHFASPGNTLHVIGGATSASKGSAQVAA